MFSSLRRTLVVGAFGVAMFLLMIVTAKPAAASAPHNAANCPSGNFACLRANHVRFVQPARVVRVVTPVYVAPRYIPQYVAPRYVAPQYVAPQYVAPQYVAPYAMPYSPVNYAMPYTPTYAPGNCSGCNRCGGY